jgi:hypothetical protein
MSLNCFKDMLHNFSLNDFLELRKDLWLLNLSRIIYPLNLAKNRRNFVKLSQLWVQLLCQNPKNASFKAILDNVRLTGNVMNGFLSDISTALGISLFLICSWLVSYN